MNRTLSKWIRQWQKLGPDFERSVESPFAYPVVSFQLFWKNFCSKIQLIRKNLSGKDYVHQVSIREINYWKRRRIDNVVTVTLLYFLLSIIHSSTILFDTLSVLQDKAINYPKYLMKTAYFLKIKHPPHIKSNLSKFVNDKEQIQVCFIQA